MVYILLGMIWATITGLGTYLAFSNDGRVGLSIGASVVSFLMGTLIAYMTTPVIGLAYIGFWAYVVSPVFLTIILIGLIKIEGHPWESSLPVIPVYTSLMVILLVVTFVTTSPMVNSKKYHSLLEVVQEEQFDPNSVLLDQTQARFVDQDLAVRSANEILGKNRGMASRYAVDKMRIQNVDGELRWLAPFTHSSFRRWFDDSTSPGYVSVSVSEYSDSRMETEDSNINYGDRNFYFSTYIYRHVYSNGYATTPVEDFTLEIDDDGKSFWVGAIVEPQVGFSGKIVVGVLVVDANTGGIEEYGIDSVPNWIDRIQPEYIVEELVSDWGKYGNGWWDAFVGNNVIVPTRGSSIVFTQDNKPSWYTGMRSNSASNSESSMGFMLIDSRTGASTFYQRAGITEQVAKETIEGRVQEAGYTSSAPIPYNISGRTTFLSILKDKRGNIQGVGLIAYDDRSLVVVGDNFNIALRRYMSVLASNGDVSLNDNIMVVNIESSIDRFYVQTVDSRLVLNFTVSDPQYAGIVFTASADSNKGAMLARKGDMVRFDALAIEDDEVQVNKFVNTELFSE